MVSGVLSGAFCKKWETIASDALSFCRYLAVVHGGGYNKSRAQDVLAKLLEDHEKHFSKLNEKYESHIKWEDEIFSPGS